MPYSQITKVGNKWCFQNKDTGERICSDTYENAVAAMRARYAHAKEGEEKKEE